MAFDNYFVETMMMIVKMMVLLSPTLRHARKSCPNVPEALFDRATPQPG
jgi:hypothetical protein